MKIIRFNTLSPEEQFEQSISRLADFTDMLYKVARQKTSGGTADPYITFDARLLRRCSKDARLDIEIARRLFERSGG